MPDETSAPVTRRHVLTASAVAVGGAAVLRSRLAHAQTAPANGGLQGRDDPPPAQGGNRPEEAQPLPPGEPGRDYNPVVTPNGWALPYRIVDGWKVFHMTADVVPHHEFAEGLVCETWGFNGSTHGPTIEAVEGDRIRIYVTNRLPAPTAVHWHGLLLPSGMDGVGGLSQRAIKPGETFKYEFVLKQHGTFMYHSHHDEMTQMALGMMGLFVIHPRNVPPDQRPQRDFAFMLSEWAIKPGTRRPDPNVMTDFNLLTLNARCFPGTAPLVVKKGDRVRMRFGNLSAMDHHPIHLHGYQFWITETDGGPIPKSARWPETTVLVWVGSTKTIEFVADAPGDWAMHCHMTHHVMNQMGHDIPNMIGMNPEGLDEKVRPLLPAYMTMGQEGMGDMGDMGMAVPKNSIPMVGAQGPHDYITMGGMFTILKVRDDLPNGYDVDPGWYENPPGTLADVAASSELEADGIATDGSTAPVPPESAQMASRPFPPPPTSDRAPGDAPGHGGHGAPQQAATIYTCPMHPEVTSTDPEMRCPKCRMRLVEKK